MAASNATVGAASAVSAHAANRTAARTVALTGATAKPIKATATNATAATIVASIGRLSELRRQRGTGTAPSAACTASSGR